MSKVRFVGLDVHKDSIVKSVAESGTAESKVLGNLQFFLLARVGAKGGRQAG